MVCRVSAGNLGLFYPLELRFAMLNIPGEHPKSKLLFNLERASRTIPAFHAQVVERLPLAQVGEKSPLPAVAVAGQVVKQLPAVAW